MAVEKTAVRANSFDLLRLAAALMVFWSHQFVMMGVPEIHSPVFNGWLGVNIFFAISGYLNVQSVVDNPSWWRFLVRRARRIYPALVGLSVFCIALGLAVSTVSPDIFWARVPTFVLKNSAILFGLEHSLPGVFEGNPYPSAMNGSLWTLPSEIKLYIYLAIIAVAVRYRPVLFLVVLAAFFVGLLIWFQVTTKSVETAYFSQFAVVFLAGALFALVERIHGIRAAVIVTMGLAAMVALTSPVVAMLPAIAFAAILVGKMQSPAWLRPPIDISYGVYLYAFPMQQLIASYGLPFATSLVISLFATLALAVASALLIEQPALRWRSRQTLVAKQAPPL
jgi:peptidoglycan/LPS O-acetylase OafA/YrhL